MPLEATLYGHVDEHNAELVAFARWQGRDDLHAVVMAIPGKEVHGVGGQLVAVLSAWHLETTIAVIEAMGDAIRCSDLSALRRALESDDRGVSYASRRGESGD